MSTRAKYRFCFTLDTEPDNLWSDPSPLTFDHFSRLEDFHRDLVQRGARPTYLATSEVAEHPQASRVLGNILESGCAEIGAHFHTWTRQWPFEVPDFGNPPVHACAHQLGQELEERMLGYTCDALNRAFGIRPTSYRGGRWSLSDCSLRSLRNNGICVDSTVTPGLTWESDGHPLASGPDFRFFPTHPFHLDRNSLQPSDRGDILELPVGAAFLPDFQTALRKDFFTRLSGRIRRALGSFQGILWLRPTLMRRAEMRACLDALRRSGVMVWVAMIHSSEIIPCKYFSSEQEVERFRERCLGLVEDAIEMGATGATLGEVWRDYEHPS